MTETKPFDADRIREEFNRWAEAGRGDEMEKDHRRIAEQTLARMNIQPTDNILDLGCGAGWLCRILSAEAPEGRVVGVDVADEMVRRARVNTVECGNVVAAVGSAEEIPWEDSFFTKVISVESAYYWPDPARGLREIFRVLREGGSVWILINYYRDNAHCHQWGPLLPIATHLLGAEEWAAHFTNAGFADVQHTRIVDDTPSPEVYTGRWFRDAAQLRAFKQEGALLVWGTKPAVERPPDPRNLRVL
ncbi:MAG TPA: methyltransferase domain-containing protein [Candidatus Acidoferrales bacterium]